MYICHWKENAIVNIAANHLTDEPIQKVKRYCASAKKHIEISQPNLIRQYNYGMGSVDVLDKMLSSYRPQLRTKIWWWNLFNNAVNLAVVTSYILFVEAKCSKMSHVGFQRQITEELLNLKPKLSLKPGPRIQPISSTRKSDRHYLENVVKKDVHSAKNCHLQCVQCKKRVHLTCFLLYHNIE